MKPLTEKTVVALPLSVMITIAVACVAGTWTAAIYAARINSRLDDTPKVREIQRWTHQLGELNSKQQPPLRVPFYPPEQQPEQYAISSEAKIEAKKN